MTENRRERERWMHGTSLNWRPSRSSSPFQIITPPPHPPIPAFSQVFHLFLYWTGTVWAVKEHKYVQAPPTSDERDCDVSPFEGREGNLFVEGGG